LDFQRARHLITADYVDHSANLRGLRGEEALAALFDLVRRTIRTMSRAAPAVAHLNGGITITGISIYRIEHGRIAERWTALSM
jgi:predicted SnoaL-like aldol condensation-catalyzing enzyme